MERQTSPDDMTNYGVEIIPFVKNKAIFERVKAPRFGDRKWGSIINTTPLSIAESRQL
jgi:hypothetical protein